MQQEVMEIAISARAASRELGRASTANKNMALLTMAQLLDQKHDEIEARNLQDLENARVSGIEKRLVDRLVFGKKKIDSRIMALEAIAELKDPVGDIGEMIRMPNGISVGRMRVPIGVIAMVYESRPHVTVNAGALCLKSGNAVVLRGGSEVINTNRYLGDLWTMALEEAGLPAESIQVIQTTDRAAVRALLEMERYIDLVIPRGGEGLIRTVLEISKIPVIKHFYGICHVFVDGTADLEMALNICVDSKAYAPEVCNAAETFLVAESVANEFLPRLLKAMGRHGVEVRGCERSMRLNTGIKEAVDADWSAEYLDLVVSVKVVKDVHDAVNHINRYGSGHTESIVSNSFDSIGSFLQGVDSGVLVVNASTMFCDGSELGMGAEIGISTDKIHARGPMGIEDLTTYKNLVIGSGNVMGDLRWE